MATNEIQHIKDKSQGENAKVKTLFIVYLCILKDWASLGWGLKRPELKPSVSDRLGRRAAGMDSMRCFLNRVTLCHFVTLMKNLHTTITVYKMFEGRVCLVSCCFGHTCKIQHITH